MMKSLKLVGIVLAMVALVALAHVLAPSAYGQGRARGDRMAPPDPRDRTLMTLAGRGAEIGVRIADGAEGGVVVEEVVPDSPAEKAGLRRSDVIVEFDGEPVRGARQFRRLVEETPPGRTVKATIRRDGQRQDVQITASEGRDARTLLDGGALRGLQRDLDRLGDRLPPFNFNFDFDLPGALSGRRLGATVDELTDQLAQFFGAREGVLVTAVTDGSAASQAGLKAGDVITSIDGQPIRSRGDMIRALRDATADEVTIGIVREKKESSLKAKLEAPRRLRGARPA
jgi:serine protease Do